MTGPIQKLFGLRHRLDINATVPGQAGGKIDGLLINQVFGINDPDDFSDIAAGKVMHHPTKSGNGRQVAKMTVGKIRDNPEARFEIRDPEAHIGEKTLQISLGDVAADVCNASSGLTNTRVESGVFRASALPSKIHFSARSLSCSST